MNGAGANNKEKWTYYLLGLLTAMALLVLVAATDVGPPNYGRYQISAWASELGGGKAGVGVFVVDTATGETKTAYSRIYGGADNGTVVKDGLGKTFHSIK